MAANSRRHGNIVGYWGVLGSDGLTPQTEAVVANQFSRAQYLGQDVDQFAFFVSVDAPTTITLLAAHSSQLNSEGQDFDRTTPPNYLLFYPVQWQSTPISVTFSKKGTACYIVPDFVPGWTMLQSSGPCNILGGGEAIGR